MTIFYGAKFSIESPRILEFAWLHWSLMTLRPTGGFTISMVSQSKVAQSYAKNFLS